MRKSLLVLLQWAPFAVGLLPPPANGSASSRLAGVGSLETARQR